MSREKHSCPQVNVPSINLDSASLPLHLPPYLFWLFMDSTILVFSNFISTLLGMSFSVSLLSTDRDFEGSPRPGEGQGESQEGLAQTPTPWSRRE